MYEANGSTIRDSTKSEVSSVSTWLLSFELIKQADQNHSTIATVTAINLNAYVNNVAVS